MEKQHQDPLFVKKVKEVVKDQPEGEEILCTEKDIFWMQDPHGYFTIKEFPDEDVIKVRYYTNGHQRKYLFVGKTPQQLYYKILQMKLISSLEHAAYLGKELEKAYLALKYGLKYNQDDELELKSP